MGYYTYYTISFEGEEKQIDAFKKELLDFAKNEDDNYDVDLDVLLKYGSSEGKLYDLEHWISSVAPKYPDVLICLEGDGEESDDLWEERWKGNNRESQRAIIPPFENPELKTKYEKTHNL